MKLSKHTILTKIYDSENYILVNYLSGSADLLDKNEANLLQNSITQKNWENYHLTPYLMERGYLFTSWEEEDSLIQSKYLEFLEENEKTATQLIFSTSYRCNFSCIYCFQKDYEQTIEKISKNVTDQFFSYINQKFSNEKAQTYITLFGGEPLLGSEEYKNSLLYFLGKATRYNYPIAIVTNGYELINYIPLLQNVGVKVKEIQVTVDGTEVTHNSRRPTKSKNETFARVMDGVDYALQSGYRINLRSVVDRSNIQELPHLAQYCNDRGFLDYPTNLFETTLGRNYELHTPQGTDQILNRYDMWLEFYNLAKKYPILKKYHKPSFHGMRFLSENDEMPLPIFDGCPACKKEWAFDANGDIFGCTASVGVQKYKLGNFLNNPEFTHKEQLAKWQERDVLTIEECKDCPVNLSCGGGCGVIAANQTGRIQSTDCRPVKELIGLGAAYYGIGG
ncbi:MAG: radical SAM protein [Leptospiraceae bacterium]|nr:radical SAM protein [Leptospiraceae bacterium]MCP5496043.1 radical SAM protein [Leptospiraceae bacterium]